MSDIRINTDDPVSRHFITVDICFEAEYNSILYPMQQTS